MPPSEQLERELSLLLHHAQVERRLPSVSACVFRDGIVIWSQAIGLADAGREERATSDHQYRIGSITKTFTAAAIMQLREAGRLELDDPLGRHVPEAVKGDATIRRLLSHLSGLQREPPGDIWESLAMPSVEGLVAGLAEAEQVLEPGERWHYSNLAYGLLGEVVARASGKPYARYVEERLFRPLGLARTTWEPEEPAARGYYVDPYSDTVRPEHQPRENGTAAFGKLWSTTGDLARWGACLVQPPPNVLSERSVEAMRSPQTMADDRWTRGWGLGLELYRSGERVFAGHGGGMPGFLTGLLVSVSERVGAVVLTSSGAGAEPEALALRLAERTLQLEPAEPQPWRPDEGPPSDLAGALGRWWTEGVEFVFRFREGRLEARSATAPKERPPAVFAREDADRYRTVSGREHGELLRLVRDEAGTVTRMYWATYPLTRSPELFGPQP